MTKSIYEQLKKDTRFCIASKIWYKEYPFRITFKRWNLDIETLNYYHRNQDINRTITNLGHEFKSRNDMTYNLYLKDESAVTDVLKLFNKDILEIWGPVNETQKDMMIEDLTCTVRKKFFYNKYQYKVSFEMYRYSNDMDTFIEIADFVKDSFLEGTYYLNTVLQNYARWKEIDQSIVKSSNPFSFHPRLPYRATGTVYLKDYSDVCTLHLMFKNDITSTTKVVLIEKIE